MNISCPKLTTQQLRVTGATAQQLRNSLGRLRLFRIRNSHWLHLSDASMQIRWRRYLPWIPLIPQFKSCLGCDFPNNMPARESHNVFRQGRLIGRLHRRCSEALDDCISYVKLQAFAAYMGCWQPGKADLGDLPVVPTDRHPFCGRRHLSVFNQQNDSTRENKPQGLLRRLFIGYVSPYERGVERIYDLRPCNVIGSHRSSRICTEKLPKVQEDT